MALTIRAVRPPCESATESISAPSSSAARTSFVDPFTDAAGLQARIRYTTMLVGHEHTLWRAQSTARKEAVEVSPGRSLARRFLRRSCMLLHSMLSPFRPVAGACGILGPYPPRANGRSVSRYHGHPVPRRSPRPCPGRSFSLGLHTIRAISAKLSLRGLLELGFDLDRTPQSCRCRPTGR